MCVTQSHLFLDVFLDVITMHLLVNLLIIYSVSKDEAGCLLTCVGPTPISLCLPAVVVQLLFTEFF